MSFFQWENITLCVVCVYFPSGLQSSGLKPTTTNKKHRKNFQVAFDLCDFIEDLRAQYTHTIVCGDLNECYNDERCPKGRHKPPRFIPRLTTALVDCGRVSPHNTYFARCNTSGTPRSSKLDRFLVSPAIVNSISSYYVLKHPPFISDHRPVVIDVTLENVDTSEFENLPDPPFFHKHLTIYDRSPEAISRACTELDAAFSDLEIPNMFSTPDKLQSAFENLSDTIRSSVRRHTKTTATSGSHQLFDRTLCKTRGDFRSLKHFVTSYLTRTSSPSVSEFRDMYPSKRRHTCESTAGRHGFILPSHPTVSLWTSFVVSITSYAKELSRMIREDARQRALTHERRRAQIFRSDRHRFYSQYLDGATVASYASRIYDSESQRVVSEPKKLAEVLHREASSLLCQPQPPPTDPPEWFHLLYRFNAKGVDPSIWDNFMSDFSTDEVLAAIADGDTSPGASGITKLALRLITSSEYRDKGSPNVTLSYLTSFLNSFLRSEISCDYSSVGLLVLIPKPGKRFSQRYRDKRPLTMINEIPKIAHSILATRLRTILTEHELLHPANRAYLNGASTYECNRILIDRIEYCIANNLPLAGIFYDYSKAFDRLNWWHPRLAFRRFAIPESFSNFLFSYLEQARTYIRTSYGLTHAVDILTSARQGDPLSQYIWQLCVEPLHHMLNTESYDHSITSYPFSCSLGYSDDTGAIGSSPRLLRTMHTKVVDFSDVHCMVLNSEKAESFAINMTHDQRTQLADPVFRVGTRQLDFLEDHQWWYLGIKYSSQLDWTYHLDHLETAFITPTAAKISHTNFTLEQIVSIYREKIISRVQYTAQLLFIPISYLKKWDTYIYRAIRRSLPRVYQSVTRDGLYHLLRIKPLETYAPIITLSELMIRLNTDTTVAPLERLRVQEFIDDYGTIIPPGRDQSTFGRTINYWLRKGYRIQVNLHSYQYSQTLTPMLPNTPSPWDGVNVASRSVVDVYTDTSPNSDTPTAGISSVTSSITRSGIFTSTRHHATSCRVETGGFTFLGEALAVIRSLETCPPNPMRVFSDCERLVQQSNRFQSLPQREKLRTPFRCIYNHLQRLFSSHPSTIEILHVKAHTNFTDPRSVGNEVAHNHARAARSCHDVTSPNLLVGEERYVLYDNDSLVVDDYRHHLLAESRDLQFQRWTSAKFQGHIARHVNSPTYQFPDPITSFQISLLTRTLPTGRVICHSHRVPQTCPFCFLSTVDDTRHFFCCPATIPTPTQLPSPPNPPTYGTHTSVLEHIQSHLIFQNPTIPNHILKRLSNLYTLFCHKNSRKISPITFRLLTLSLRPHRAQPIHTLALSVELQRIFNCGSQLCTSYLDITPQTFRWFSLCGKSTEEFCGFDFYDDQVFGNFICSFPIDASIHAALLTHIEKLSHSSYPFRAVLFTSTIDQVPNFFSDFLLPQAMGPFKIFLVQNHAAEMTLPVDLTRYFRFFDSHYSRARQIIPRLTSVSQFLQSLDSFSDYFWLPELGLRCIAPPTIDMVEHDPVIFGSIPVELRILGLQSPNFNLSYLKSPSFTYVQQLLQPIFERLYRRRAHIWLRYCQCLSQCKTSS